MRCHSRLRSFQKAASSITYGALDIQRATGLRNMPDLTEKSSINTFLLFSPSLSPDLFMFLELCLHCLALIKGDGGRCSTRRNDIFVDITIGECVSISRLCHVCRKRVAIIFCIILLFVERFLKETLKAHQ